jgi:peptidoglycan hydrolase CwlO-like protein
LDEGEAMTVFAFTVTVTHIVALLGASVPSIYVGRLVYKSARAATLQAAQAGVTVQQDVRTGQVLSALDNLVQRLTEELSRVQDDAGNLRAEIARLLDQAAKMNAALDAQDDRIASQNSLISELTAQIAELRLTNGANGMIGPQ